MAWMDRLRCYDGAFTRHVDGELDIRGVYCALSTARFLNIYSPELFHIREGCKKDSLKLPKDNLGMDAAEEASLESQCNYKYLFNYRGVAASFSLEHLFLYASKLPLQEKMTVLTLWDRLRDNLESLPRSSACFHTTKLLDLPQQQQEVLQIPENLIDEVDNNGTELGAGQHFTCCATTLRRSGPMIRLKDYQ